MPPNQHSRPSWKHTDVGQPATPDHCDSTQSVVGVSVENGVNTSMFTEVGEL